MINKQLNNLQLSDDSTNFESQQCNIHVVNAIDMNTMLECFNQLDRQKRGYININQLDEYLQTLYKRQINYQIFITNLLLNGEKLLTFDDLIMLGTEIDYYEALAKVIKNESPGLSRQQCEAMLIYSELRTIDERRRDFLENTKLQDFQNLLKQYERKAEQQGDYREAKRIQEKIKEIQLKQQRRWQWYIQTLQKYQIKRAQMGAENSMQDFTDQWKTFSETYQKKAFTHLKILRTQQEQQLKNEEIKVRDELIIRSKLPKRLNELRNQQQQLGRMRRYDLAEIVKDKADISELKERKILDNQIENSVGIKLRGMKKFHEQQTKAFLRRIQKERNAQIVQRKVDSYKLQNISKNQQNGINYKYNREQDPTYSSKKQFDLLRFNTPKSTSQSLWIRNRANSCQTAPRIKQRIDDSHEL